MVKILIIQDSPVINMMLKAMLEEELFAVDTVETGTEGIQKARMGQYQLILLDYMLPDIDGPEVCRILRKGDNTKSTPVVFISAKDEEKIS